MLDGRDCWNWVSRLALVSVLVCVFVSAVTAQEPDTEPSGVTADDPTTVEALTARRTALQAEIKALHTGLTSVTSASPAAAHVNAQIELLNAIDALLSQALEERRILDTSPVEARSEDLPDPSILVLNDLHEELERDQNRMADLERALEANRETLSTVEKAFKDAERERRRLQQEQKNEPSQHVERALDLARLRSRVARETIHLHKIKLQRDRSTLAAYRAQVESLEGRIHDLKEQLRTVPRIVSPTADLARHEGEVRRQREAAQRELDSLALRLKNATSRFEAQADPPPKLLEEVETLRFARDSQAQEIQALDARLDRLSVQRPLLDQWLAVIRGHVPEVDLRQSEATVRDAVEAYRRDAIQRQGRLAELNERLDNLSQRLAAADLEPSLRPPLEQRLRVIEQLIAFHTTDVADITYHQRLHDRFRKDVQEASGHVPLSERLTSFGTTIGGFWNYEITSVEDKPITVGNAFLALILLALGFMVSRRLSTRLRMLIESRLQLEPGVAGAIQTATFYVLLISFTLFALRTVNFPLTVFTVAGGALAIGIGFGSQNVMNNFISGLILMLERPVRTHDLVEVEGTYGTVELIGARSTRIRTTDGRHLITPNSFFLENSVVNWTLSDELIRTKVVVGVIYGSPTRLVAQLIQQALDENKSILKQPAPIINFAEFGDNSLNFEAHFWMRARTPMAVQQVQSQVRFRIDDLFREHSLVIAFPQRDVHLDSVSPIEVRVLSGTQATSAEKSEEVRRDTL